MTGDYVLCKNWYLKPRPQNRILVPLRGPFQNFRRTKASFKHESMDKTRLKIILISNLDDLPVIH